MQDDDHSSLEEGIVFSTEAGDPTTTKSDADTNSSTTGSDHGSDAPTKNKNLKIAVCVLAALAVLGATFGGGFAAGAKKESNKYKNESTKTTTQSSSQASSNAGFNSNSNPRPFGDDDYANMDDDFVFVKPFGGEEGLTIPSFTAEEVLEGYESREDLAADLTVYFQDIANGVMEQNVMYNMPGSNNHHMEFSENMTEMDMMMMDMGMRPPPMIVAEARPETEDMDVLEETDDAIVTEVAQEAAASVSEASAKTHETTLTNNQEKDVDEADFAKNDENYIYGLYGQYLVVLDRRNGTVVTKEKLKMPEFVLPEGTMDGVDPMMEEMMMEEMMFMGQMGHAQFLQLTDDHVLIAVSSPEMYNPMTGMPMSSTGSTMLVYTKPTLEKPELALVASQGMPGQVLDSRYLEDSDSIHITTTMTWNNRFQELEYWNFENNHGRMSRAEYVEKATAKAEEIIAELVKELAELLMPTDDANTMLVSSWQRQGATLEEDPYSKMNRGAAIITAVRAQDLPTTAGEAVIPTTTASMMVPNTYGSQVYATDDSIVVYATMYGIDTETQMGTESLALTLLKVDPATASMTFHSVGTTSGHVPSKYGIDINGNDLRLATVLNVGIAEDAWADLEEVCGTDWMMDECVNMTAFDNCANLMLAGCQNVESTGCPKEFTCADDETTQQNLNSSSTANHIVVMDISEPGEMKELGRVRIGKVNEVIFGARFGETFVYANTFDQQDPFYAIELPPGQGPKILGSVELEGFYRFIEPLNDEGTLLVALGQNVTEEHNMMMPVGVMLTVFDVSTPSNPIVVDSKMVAQTENTEVSSNALYEPKTIQHQDGILVIPMNSYMTGYTINFNGMSTNFDGFIVVDVGNAAEQGIKELFQVDHTCTGNGCYSGCAGRLQSYRSFFYEETVATMSSQLVVGSSVPAGDVLWSTVVETEEEEQGMRGCWW